MNGKHWSKMRQEQDGRKRQERPKNEKAKKKKEEGGEGSIFKMVLSSKLFIC